jgi:hypothetical protein
VPDTSPLPEIIFKKKKEKENEKFVGEFGGAQQLFYCLEKIHKEKEKNSPAIIPASVIEFPRCNLTSLIEAIVVS